LIWMDSVVDSATGVGADVTDALEFGRILKAMKVLEVSATVTLATTRRDVGTFSTTATLFKKDVWYELVTEAKGCDTLSCTDTVKVDTTVPAVKVELLQSTPENRLEHVHTSVAEHMPLLVQPLVMHVYGAVNVTSWLEASESPTADLLDTLHCTDTPEPRPVNMSCVVVINALAEGRWVKLPPPSEHSTL
jgi:hypothetical protein